MKKPTGSKTRKKKPPISSSPKDIPGQKGVEAQVEQLLKRIELIMGATRTGLDIIDPDFNLRYVDPAWQKVYGDFVGRKCYEYFMGRTEACPGCGIPIALATKAPVRSEEVLPGEGNRPIEVVTIPFQDEKGEWLVAEINIDIAERKQAEDTLQESERKFREIFNKVNDAIHLHEIGEDGRPGKFIDVNDVACQMVQYSREEMLQHTPLDFATEYHSRPVYRILEELRTVGHAVFETGHRRKDGTIVPVEINAHVITLQGKKVVLSVVRDISERKKAQEKVRNAARQLSDIIENLPDATFVIDTKGVVIAWNRTIEAMTGIKKEEMIGKGDFEYALPFYGSRRPILIDLVFSTKDEIVKNYSSVKIDDSTIFAETFVPGTYQGKGAYLWGTASPLFDAQGSLYGAIESIRDISDIKMAAAALRASEDRLNLAIESAHLGLWDLNIVTNEVVHNRLWAEMLGFSMDEMEKPSDWWAQRVYPDDLPHVQKSSEDHYSGKSPFFDVVYRMRHKDGSWRWVHSQGKVVARDIDGRPLRMIGINQDITEQKRAETALQESEERLNLAINSANLGLWDMNLLTGEMVHNRRWADMLGFSIDELEKPSVWWGERVHPDDYPNVLKLSNRHRAGEVPLFDAVYRMKHKDGSWRWVHSQGKVVSRDTDGQPLRMIGINQDITEQKRAEETQQQLTEFRESVITNARVWMSVLDQTGRILIWNTAAEEISGYRAEEVIGKNEIWKMLYPKKEYRKHITDTINRIIHDRKYLENFETTIRSKQGKEKVISWNTKGIPDAAGRISDYIAIGVDVTDRQLAEQMLRESEERYRTVIENASEAIVVAQDGLLKFANQRTMGLLQSTPEKIIGRPFTDFIHPDDRALVFERYQRRIKGENVPVNYDFRLVGENGRLVWVIISAVRITWEGRPATLNFLTEITDRKQIEAALRESEGKFRTVLENVPDLILVHRNGIILYVNPAMIQTMKYTPEEVINTPLIGYIVPEYHGRVAEAISRRLAGETVEPYEIELLTKGGGRRNVIIRGTMIEFAGSPASLNVLTDITERKQVEAALYETEERYRSLFDRSLDCVYIHDFEGNFIDANPSALKMLGYTRDEITAVNFTSLLTPDKVPGAQKAIREVIATGTQKESSEYRVRRKDGTYVDVETTATLLYHEGKPYAIQGFAHDITDRKRAEEEIQLLNATLEQRVRDRTKELEQATETIRASLDEKVILLREIHHRVKNNLQIIISLTNLQMRQIDDKQLKQVMVETQNRVRAMSFVHEKLYQSENLSHIDLSEYTRYLVTHLFAFYRVNSQQVSLNLDIKKIMLDINTAIPVGLTINELVSNSLKHAFPDGRKGEIFIAIHKEDHTITILFKDNGVGIPADLDWRNTKSLGLRLVIILVEQLSGTIELDRSAGTTFNIVVQEKE